MLHDAAEQIRRDWPVGEFCPDACNCNDNVDDYHPRAGSTGSGAIRTSGRTRNGTTGSVRTDDAIRCLVADARMAHLYGVDYGAVGDELMNEDDFALVLWDIWLQSCGRDDCSCHASGIAETQLRTMFGPRWHEIMRRRTMETR